MKALRGVIAMDDSQQYIILFPYYQELKEKIEKMRTELSMLLLERDELKLVICKNIESAYCIKFGAAEYKAYQAYCDAMRLKRKTEMIQARLNRQEIIDISNIEESLDEEFSEYQKKLDEQIDKISDALERSKLEVLSSEEAKEFKKMYRKIVKALHPDLNPNATEAQIRLFQNAVSAYENGDIASLRVIETMVLSIENSEKSQDAVAELEGECKRLEQTLTFIKESIAQIKSSFPYTIKEYVEDSEKEKQYLKELEEATEYYNSLIHQYKEKLGEMLR